MSRNCSSARASGSAPWTVTGMSASRPAPARRVGAPGSALRVARWACRRAASIVAVGEHAADDALAGTADQDGWVWSLRRLGPGPDGSEVDVAAVELRLLLGPDRAHRLHALVHDRPAGRSVDVVVGDLLGDPA